MVGIAMVPAPTLAITPTVTVPGSAGLTTLAPRATTYSYGIDDCYDYDAMNSCAGSYESCLTGINYYTNTNAYDAYDTCYCTYGAQYLDCYYSVLQKGASCTQYDYYFSGTYWSSFYSSWFINYCGSVPPMTATSSNAAAPTSVSLEFASVTIVTASGPISQPTYATSPLYQSSGNLLSGDCTRTEFTLVDIGATVYYAPFVGCVSDRPECCPWTVATASLAFTPSGDTTVTVTMTATADNGQSGQKSMAYPQPKDQQALKACADDYYETGGNCCPSNYFPFTQELAGATPCYSSMNNAGTAPTLTAGLAGQPTDTSKPTSAVVNVVWAMSYPVQSSSSPLSTGAIAGIAGGGVAALALIAGLVLWLVRTKRKNKKLEVQVGQTPPDQPRTGPAELGQGQGLPPMVPGMGMGEKHVSTMHDPRGCSMMTTPSTLVPQPTGTTVSELSSPSSGMPLVYGHGQGHSYPSSPGPATIVEADGGSAMHGQYPYPQQSGQFGQPMPQGGYFVPQPGQMVPPQGGMYPMYATQPGAPVEMHVQHGPQGHMPMPGSPPPQPQELNAVPGQVQHTHGELAGN